MNKKNFRSVENQASILLKNGHILDPSVSLDKNADILIRQGKIAEIGKIDESSFGGKILDLKGKYIVPGFFDLHVHFREPGYEGAETIKSGISSAMAGGFTGVCVMPNTSPACDNRGQVDYINEKARGSIVDVFPIGAVTKKREGNELTEMADMVEGGAVAFSDDGSPVKTGAILRSAIEYASMLNRVIIDHCEDTAISQDGVMNESIVSTELGMKGIPSISEEIIVARDIAVAEYINKPVHLAHISTAGSVRLIRDAKKRGMKVTAETCPHYLTLTEEEVRDFDPNFKMNPPLRGEKDREELIKAIKDGTIDAIVTDHAPHSIERKDKEFNSSAFGVIGLETAIGVILTHLVHKNKISMSDLVFLYSINPRRILGVTPVRIQKGENANLSIFDPNKVWIVKKEEFLSKSRNTPFDNWELIGKCTGIYNQSKLYYSE
ncbi:dihydroorotase [bacterium]|nr:dihydroorotase [bacterium]